MKTLDDDHQEHSIVKMFAFVKENINILVCT